MIDVALAVGKFMIGMLGLLACLYVRQWYHVHVKGVTRHDYRQA